MKPLQPLAPKRRDDLDGFDDLDSSVLDARRSMRFRILAAAHGEAPPPAPTRYAVTASLLRSIPTYNEQ